MIARQHCTSLRTNFFTLFGQKFSCLYYFKTRDTGPFGCVEMSQLSPSGLTRYELRQRALASSWCPGICWCHASAFINHKKDPPVTQPNHSTHFMITDFRMDAKEWRSLIFNEHVKTAMYGIEVCPSTKKEHFQAYVESTVDECTYCFQRRFPYFQNMHIECMYSIVPFCLKYNEKSGKHTYLVKDHEAKMMPEMFGFPSPTPNSEEKSGIPGPTDQKGSPPKN